VRDPKKGKQFLMTLGGSDSSDGKEVSKKKTLGRERVTYFYGPLKVTRRKGRKGSDHLKSWEL